MGCFLLLLDPPEVSTAHQGSSSCYCNSPFAVSIRALIIASWTTAEERVFGEGSRTTEGWSWTSASLPDRVSQSCRRIVLQGERPMANTSEKVLIQLHTYIGRRPLKL